MNDIYRPMYEAFIETFTRLQLAMSCLEMLAEEQPDNQDLARARKALGRLGAEMDAIRQQWAAIRHDNGLPAGPDLSRLGTS